MADTKILDVYIPCQTCGELIPAGGNNRCLTCRLIDLALEPKLKWIPVTERLPTIEDATEKGAVLAWEVSVKHWDIWAWDCVRDYPDRFIGWMPLPEPPKGE